MEFAQGCARQGYHPLCARVRFCAKEDDLVPDQLALFRQFDAPVASLGVFSSRGPGGFSRQRASAPPPYAKP
eukprot:407933-Lingulodinium_polyedra.AAC.1